MLISALSMHLPPVLWACIRAPATHFLGARILTTLTISTPPAAFSAFPLLCNWTVLPVPLLTGPYLGATVVNLAYTYLTRTKFEYKTSRDQRSRWCHLSTIPGTTQHCLVSIGRDVRLGTWSTLNPPITTARLQVMYLNVIRVSPPFEINKEFYNLLPTPETYPIAAVRAVIYFTFI